MDSDDDDSPAASDGELSFSRWRSNGRSPASHPLDPDPPLDFHPQLDSDSLNSAEIETSASATAPRAAAARLGDRRGVAISISPLRHADAAWNEIGLASASPVVGAPVAVSDQEFEREFGFHSLTAEKPPPPPPEAGVVAADRRPHHHHMLRMSSDSASSPHSEDDRHSHGSSELSFQDMLDGQNQERFSSSVGRGPILVVFLRTIALILLWYFFSTGLTIYNKKLLGQHMWDFPAPMLMNTVHFGLQAIISSLALRFFFPSMRPVDMSWKDYSIRVIPVAVATALDIDLTNASLVFISISFETMCKSSAPVFLLLFAFAFKLESPSLKLFGIISIISSGVLLTGLGSLRNTKSEEKHFEVLGFILVLLAALMSGFRWTVTQVLLQKEEFGLNNPLAVISYVAPVMAIATAILSLATEPLHKLAEEPFFNTYHNALVSSILLLLGGSLAFFMVLAEYLLISKTSAVTLTVAGVVKEMVTIVVAVAFFGDQFTTLIGVGLAIIMVGVSWFNWFKYQKYREEKHSDDLEFEKIPVRYTPLKNMTEENDQLYNF